MTIQAVLGIDTSNYTASLAVIHAENGEVLSDARELVQLSAGRKGLRQSDALFFHVSNLPDVLSKMTLSLPYGAIEWKGIGVSVRPRPFSSSYMPVFKAGELLAYSFASMGRIPVVRTSHQEGHLAAAVRATQIETDKSFFAVHLSGGTSDVLLAKSTRFGYAITMLGEGADLHAGQFVDRVGVHLGLPFPAGQSLERLAATADEESSFRLPSRSLGSSLSFSGSCSAAIRALESGVPAASVALAVQSSIAAAVIKAIVYASENHPGVNTLVIAGGVASNQWIKNRVIKRLRIVLPRLDVHFAEPKYARDNAIGVATIARRFLLDRKM